MYFSWSSGLAANKPTLSVGQYYMATDTGVLTFKDVNGVEQSIDFDSRVGLNGKLLIATYNITTDTITVLRQVGYTDLNLFVSQQQLVVTSEGAEFDPETLILINQSVNYTTDATAGSPFTTVSFDLSQSTGIFYFEMRS